MNDDHPADQLAQTFHDLINGEGFKQTIRQAWDRIQSSMSSAVPDAHQQQIDQMNKDATDQAVKNANKTYITPTAAANIRAKANQGGK